jgi:hypothetical protein
MPDLNNHERNQLGERFDTLGTLAVKGEVLSERPNITKRELREIMERIERLALDPIRHLIK